MLDGLRDSGGAPEPPHQKLAPAGHGCGTGFALFSRVTATSSRVLCAAAACAVAVLSFSPGVAGQTAGTTPAAAPAQPPPDALGRDTPRGTVVGFLNAARKGENQLAAQYLSTRLKGEAAAALAQQLYTVLDARLPARLTQVSDEPEGSRANPLKPNEEVVGTIAADHGSIEIVVERAPGTGGRPIWLFAGQTLNAVPALYREVTFGVAEGALPTFLTGIRVGGARAADWLLVLLALPVFYLATVVLDRMLRPVASGIRRRFLPRLTVESRPVLTAPVRLLIVAAAMRWLLTVAPLPLIVRQFGAGTTTLITIAAIVWLLISLNGQIEAYFIRRVPRARSAAARSLARVVRRAADLLMIFGGVLAVLRRFGIDPTPALAGLGVGGIAVALAAQKTLENVIAGASLIFDQAVTVGDFLKMGEISGTVDHIGLRSTRIRTLDRTIVSVPNSQIANASLETISARDKFWFHHVVGLRYETTPEQLRAIVDGLREMLASHPLTEKDSVRVRFLRLGAFSLDVDIFAYLKTLDWNHFLEVQETLLFGITDIVTRAGAEIAFPSQTMYVDQSPKIAAQSERT
jgi:MscS family membrane protein